MSASLNPHQRSLFLQEVSVNTETGQLVKAQILSGRVHRPNEVSNHSPEVETIMDEKAKRMQEPDAADGNNKTQFPPSNSHRFWWPTQDLCKVMSNRSPSIYTRQH